MKLKSLFAFMVLSLWMGCEIAPKPIAYGSDGCHFCRMTIVDRQHAAQIVTDKGKAFSFDAIECMVNSLKEIDPGTVALFLVSDYPQPGALIDATQATYLISEGIPSPMGANLSAFEELEAAIQARKKHRGTLYSWPELLDHFKK